MTENIESIETLISDLERQRDQINEQLCQARRTRDNLSNLKTSNLHVENEARLKEIVERANLLCAEVNDIIRVEL